MFLLSYIQTDLIDVRILYFIIGSLFCAIAVSLFFHTYLSPEAYELIVKEISGSYSFKISRVKTAYDCISTLLAVALSFAFFGFGVFRGVGIGTIICALVNGTVIGKITAFLEKHFKFENRFPLEKYFQR